VTATGRGLPSREEKNCFKWFSGAFVTCSPGRNSHSAVFLDDLQWLDAATLDKALEMKIDFDAAQHQRMGLGNTDRGSRAGINLRTRLPTVGP
jgi:hypothetical protein